MFGEAQCKTHSNAAETGGLLSLPIPRPLLSADGGFRFQEMLDAFGLGNYDHALFAHGEAAGPVVVVVVADLDAGRNVYALVDDRPAHLGVPPDIDPFEQDRIFNPGKAVHALVRRSR